jgi:hypothetical protein
MTKIVGGVLYWMIKVGGWIAWLPDQFCRAHHIPPFN